MRRWWAPTPDSSMPPEEWPDYVVMASTIHGEAEGESLLGKRAVAYVIMNRVADKRWPDTPAGVCLQRLQFSCWNPGAPTLHRMFNPPSEKVWNDCFRAALEAAWQMEPDPTDGANHYLARESLAKRPSWARENKVTARIGAHTFYRL